MGAPLETPAGPADGGERPLTCAPQSACVALVTRAEPGSNQGPSVDAGIEPASRPELAVAWLWRADKKRAAAELGSGAALRTDPVRASGAPTLDSVGLRTPEVAPLALSFYISR
jgi:hypothetical protein